MRALGILTVLCASLMTGSELAVSVFVNPAIWKLDDRAQAGELARSMGKVMPFWYGAALLLLGTEAYQGRGDAGGRLLLAATLIWLVTIPYSVFVLVPINNRIAASMTDTSDWRTQHKRWDRFHRWRIVLLLGAVICLLLGLGA